MVLACLWAGRGRGPADGVSLRVRGLWSETGCGGDEGRVPVDLLTRNSGLLLGGLVTPAGPCSLGGLCPVQAEQGNVDGDRGRGDGVRGWRSRQGSPELSVGPRNEFG